MSEFDTRKIPYHDIKAKGARNKKVSGSALMHMVAYEKLRPSLSNNAMPGVSRLYARCTSDDANVRPSFQEIVAELEGSIRAETEARVATSRTVSSNQPKVTATPEELGVKHPTNYTDVSNNQTNL